MSAQASFKGDNSKDQQEREQPFLHATRRLALIYMLTKYYRNISKGIHKISVYGRTDVRLIAISPEPCRSGIKISSRRQNSPLADRELTGNL